MINSTNSTNFGSTLLVKDIIKGYKHTPLSKLDATQLKALKKKAKKIGPKKNIIMLESNSQKSEVMNFHHINGEYISHKPEEYKATGVLMEQRKISNNFMDENSILGHKNTLANETFEKAIELIDKIASKLS